MYLLLFYYFLVVLVVILCSFLLLLFSIEFLASILLFSFVFVYLLQVFDLLLLWLVYLYLLVLNWQSFKFKHILKDLQFLLLFSLFCVLDIIFYIFMLIMYCLLQLQLFYNFFCPLISICKQLICFYYIIAFLIGIFSFLQILASFSFRKDPSIFLFGQVQYC